MRAKIWAAAVCVAALVAIACGGGDDGGDTGGNRTRSDGGTVVSPPPGDAGEDDGGTGDAGNDGGGDAGDDGGTGDAGPGDGGTGDGGTGDGGTEVTVEFPSSAGWKFFGRQHNGPSEVLGVTADEGGNIWVAGGTEGLFLLRKGSDTFEKFTMAEGLRPYGYMPDGSAPPGEPYLKVISVAGGPAGTVFVGYAGKPKYGDQEDCESNWDQGTPEPDPSIYKSGDADKVTLTSTGIKVVHYDIFSGPGVVKAEPRGREKLCHIRRIAYDARTGTVWFGGNHGFAMGFADFQGNPTCNGQLSCTGVYEHVHPAVAFNSTILTGDFYGVAVDPTTPGNVWFGGFIRSTRFRQGDLGYWKAQAETEGAPDLCTDYRKIDLWPDTYSGSWVTARQDDMVSSVAAMGDGSAWFGSLTNGIAHVLPSGQIDLRVGEPTLVSRYVGAVARDPNDGSLWVSGRWGGGIARMGGGTVRKYQSGSFGATLTNSPILDIQVDRSGDGRRMLVGFQGYTSKTGERVPGAIGVYGGE